MVSTNELEIIKLLEQITPDYSSISPIESYLLSLKSVLMEMRDKPANLYLIGSYPLKTMLAGFISIDVAVEMPMHIFHPKDYLNNRYFEKKSLFLILDILFMGLM